MIQAINKEVETSKVDIKNSIEAGYKQSFWLWKVYCHICERVIKLTYQKVNVKTVILLIIQ